MPFLICSCNAFADSSIFTVTALSCAIKSADILIGWSLNAFVLRGHGLMMAYALQDRTVLHEFDMLRSFAMRVCAFSSGV